MRFHLIPDSELKSIYENIEKKNWVYIAIKFKSWNVFSYNKMKSNSCKNCIDIPTLELWCNYAVKEKFITNDPSTRKAS